MPILSSPLSEILVFHKSELPLLFCIFNHFLAIKFKNSNFNYSVWYKNGLHNVYVYYEYNTYEYKYFEEKDKIRLVEVKNKKYKR